MPSKPAVGRLNIELAAPDSALGSLIIDYFLKEGVHNPANYRAALKQAGHSKFHSAREYMRSQYQVSWAQIYTFFQEACMAYFAGEYASAKIPPGPSQDSSWSDSSFDAFCDGQVKSYGIDPVRLFLLKDVRPRQDTYRMAATLRRCEIDVALCHKENAAVEAATSSVLADLRAAVLSKDSAQAKAGTPAFVELWKKSADLQEASKTAREKVLQDAFSEKRAGASAGSGATDASGEYQSALADLTSLANRLWVTDPATVEVLAKGLFADAAGGDTVSAAGAAAGSGGGKGEAELKLEEALVKLTKLRDSLDDAQLKAQLGGLLAGSGSTGEAQDEASTARALRDAVQTMEARAQRNQDALARLEDLKDEVAAAKAASSGGPDSAVDGLNSAVALLGIAASAADSSKSQANTARQSRLQAQLAKAKAGRAKLCTCTSNPHRNLISKGCS